MLTVPTCKNAIEGSCWYGTDKCWFRHTETGTQIGTNIMKNEEITEKIFKMMETFTQRIMQLEKHMEMTIHEKKDDAT